MLFTAVNFSPNPDSEQLGTGHQIQLLFVWELLAIFCVFTAGHCHQIQALHRWELISISSSLSWVLLTNLTLCSWELLTVFRLFKLGTVHQIQALNSREFLNKSWLFKLTTAHNSKAGTLELLTKSWVFTAWY
jgi:hypothetical protein